MNAIVSIWLGLFILTTVFAFLLRGMLDRIVKLEDKRMEICHLCRGWFESTIKWHEIYLVKTHVHNGEKWVPKTERIPVSHDLCSACFAKKQAEAEEKKFPSPKTSSDTTP